jgi:hypothetical protein
MVTFHSLLLIFLLYFLLFYLLHFIFSYFSFFGVCFSLYFSYSCYYRTSENECTHLKNFCSENKQSQKSTVFTIWQWRWQSWHLFYLTRMIARMLQFQDISKLNAYWARNKGSWASSAVKQRKVNFLTSCFMWWKLYSPGSDYFLDKNV